jgi:predicted lipid-binding transport protein (Tim44 family)
MGFAIRLASLGLAALVLAAAPPAIAQSKQKPAARAVKGKKAPEKTDAAKGKKEAEQAEAEGETKEEKSDAPAGAPEGAVKAAGTKETKESEKDSKTKVTGVEESAKEKGVKTYKFSAVEVEGRLKSPQIIYFLRRVRAEFEAGALGHRSFMPELSDTRRSPALK